MSTNYTGTGNPNNATWQSIKDVSTDASTAWKLFQNISLSAYKTTPFYLAFKYVSSSTATGAQEWSLDDVKIKGAGTGITDQKTTELGLMVLGQASSSRILLGINMKKAARWKSAFMTLPVAGFIMLNQQ